MPRVVRVQPDVAALTKEFDYTLPASAPPVEIGAMVRIDLHGRRVGGWVVGADLEPPPGVALRDVAKVRGRGPDPAMVELCRWAAWRWAGPVTHFLRTASPDRAVTSIPPSAPEWTDSRAEEPAEVASVFAASGGVLRIPPAGDRMPVVEAAARRGPSLVLVPAVQDVDRLADRLRRRGVPVAGMPDGWRDAAGGGRLVVGTRAAAFAPVPGLSSVVVLDAHDDRYRSEASPTWWAVEVAEERAARCGVPCVVVSPCPTVDLLHERRLIALDPAVEREGWARVEVVDRRADDPRTGLWSARLASAAKEDGRMLFILNRVGRARLLACRSCTELVRCEACGSNVGEGQEGALLCGRCGALRPRACQACGSGALRVLRVGVSRAREELEALVGAPVAEVTASTRMLPETRVLIGTEALLHRAGARGRWDVVAFVEFDQHLLAPRVTAADEAMALLARAARLVGDRRSGGRVLVQTRQPDHSVVQAAARASPGHVTEGERQVRAALRWPPMVAIADLSGPGAQEFASALGGTVEVTGPTSDGHWLVRAPDVPTLCDALAATARPAAKLRVALH